MAKKRKAFDPRKHTLLKSLAFIRLHGVMVIHVEPSGRAGLISWKDGRSVASSPDLELGIVGFPHHWTITLAVFCRSETEEYIKSVELVPDRALKAESLAAECQTEHRKLEDGCNPKHVIGKGFVASPVGKRLTEAEAEKLFALCGAWHQERFEPAGLFPDERQRLIAVLEGMAPAIQSPAESPNMRTAP